MPQTDCAICHQPLSDGELSLSRRWHFDCQRCAICGSDLPNFAQIEKCLDAQRPVSHDTCHKTQLFQDFKHKVLPLRQEHIFALNEEILQFYPAVEPTSTDISLLYDCLMKLQETATNISWALGLTKDKLRISEIQNFNHQQKEKQKIERAHAVETETEKLGKQAKAEMFKAERENPQLRARRKAIEAYTALGIPEAQAIELIDKGKEKVQ